MSERASIPERRRAGLRAPPLLGARLPRRRHGRGDLRDLRRGLHGPRLGLLDRRRDRRPRRLPRARHRRRPRLLPAAAPPARPRRGAPGRHDHPPQRLRSVGGHAGRRAVRGPDADDVAHREHPDHLRVVEDDRGGGRRDATSRRRPAPGSSRGQAAITLSLMWSATSSTSGSSPPPIESRTSRSVTIRGAGDSSSVTSAAPVPISTIIRRPPRAGCARADGEDHLRHPFAYLHLAPRFRRSTDRANRLKLIRPRVGGGKTLGWRARIYRMPPTSRAAMPEPPNPTRPLLVLAALAGGARGGRLRDRQRDVARGRVLFIQKCGTCHKMAEAGTTAQIGPDLDDAFAAPAPTGGRRHDRGHRQRAGGEPAPQHRQPGGLDAGGLGHRPGPRGCRRLRRPASPGSPARRRPKAPGGPGAQVFANNGCGGCHTLRRGEHRWRHRTKPGRGAAGQTAAMIETSIVDPNRGHRQGLPGQRDAGELRPDNHPASSSNQLVQYLADSTGAAGQRPRRLS